MTALMYHGACRPTPGPNHEPLMPSKSSKESPFRSAATLIGFRFLFVYWVLYLFPYPLSVIPGLTWLGSLTLSLWTTLVPWFGAHILGMDDTIRFQYTGSGDTLFAYVQVCLQLTLAAIVAALWSIVDRTRTRYVRLDDVLRTLIRYALGTSLIMYGMIKVIKLQFPYPTDARLIEPYGESSPMGLLWTFMGYSTPYNLFTGGVELLGGILLLFRRTTVLGACVVVGAMANVVMLNFSYDVPVKLYSTHLLLMALFLLAPHRHRIANFFVLNRPVAPEPQRIPYGHRLLERARPLIKGLFIGWFLYHEVSVAIERKASYEARLSDAGSDANSSESLVGLYNVESMSLDGSAQVGMSNDPHRWHMVAISMYKSTGRLSVRQLDGTMLQYILRYDANTETLSLSERLPGTDRLQFVHTRLDSDRLQLQGTMNDLPIRVTLRAIKRSYPLSERGFHWINEYPYNR